MQLGRKLLGLLTQQVLGHRQLGPGRADSGCGPIAIGKHRGLDRIEFSGRLAAFALGLADGTAVLIEDRQG